ncbi:MAG TPA: hypothetical protein VFA81_12705, partial [Burkholderiales bacterium]|nr:hypothetical protein [Burkholderiales bacterium]
MDPNELDLGVLEPEENQGYLPRPIPTERDEQISRILDEVLVGGAVARFVRSLEDRYSPVLRAYAERMAS